MVNWIYGKGEKGCYQQALPLPFISSLNSFCLFFSISVSYLIAPDSAPLPSIFRNPYVKNLGTLCILKMRRCPILVVNSIILIFSKSSNYYGNLFIGHQYFPSRDDRTGRKKTQFHFQKGVFKVGEKTGLTGNAWLENTVVILF